MQMRSMREIISTRVKSTKVCINKFPWNHTEWNWSDNMRFVFDLKMKTSADLSIADNTAPLRQYWHIIGHTKI